MSLTSCVPAWFRTWYSNEWKSDWLRLKFIPVLDHLYSPTVAVVQLSTIRLGSRQQMGFLRSIWMRAYCTVSSLPPISTSSSSSSLLLSDVPRGVIIGFASVWIYLWFMLCAWKKGLGDRNMWTSSQTRNISAVREILSFSFQVFLS